MSHFDKLRARLRLAVEHDAILEAAVVGDMLEQGIPVSTDKLDGLFRIACDFLARSGEPHESSWRVFWKCGATVAMNVNFGVLPDQPAGILRCAFCRPRALVGVYDLAIAGTRSSLYFSTIRELHTDLCAMQFLRQQKGS